MYPKLESIIRPSLDIWQDYLTHPFITGLADGTLAEDKFLNYLIQDTLYLREYARVYAMAMYRSTSIAEIRAYYSILSFVNDGEGSFRLEWLEREGLDTLKVDAMPLKPANRAYCDFMLQTAETEGVAGILMAVLPCMFSYAWIFQKIAAQYPESRESRYWPFIEGYISGEYEDDCRTWAAFAEERLQQLDEVELARMTDIFRQSSLYEADFWDMAFEG